jgi:hypothetical protein
LNEKFKETYTPYENVTTDESMVKFKGHLGFRAEINTLHALISLIDIYFYHILASDYHEYAEIAWHDVGNITVTHIKTLCKNAY